jgi:hypothetical protein
MAPRGLPSPSPLPPLPVGASERCLSFEQCFIHHSEEVVAAKHALQLALVTIISGNRPPVSMDQVCHWIQEHYDIPSDSVTVQHFQPEDFLITFSFYDDMLHVLHNPLPQDASFVLVFKSWTCQLRATAMKLFYHVIIRLRGIPANARHLSTARQILSPGCSKVQLANSAKDDVRSLTVHAWCVHPDLIPKAKIMHILEPEEVFVRGPPLFLNPEETIFQNHPTLHYRVEIDILKVEDWHDTSNSSSSDDDGFPPPPPPHEPQGFRPRHPFLRQWPKRTRFSDAEGSGSDVSTKAPDKGDSDHSTSS